MHENVVIKFLLTFCFIILTGLDHPILHDNGHLGTCEVLRFSDGIVDLFSNYVFNDALKFLVEMTVFGNKP